MPNIHQSVQLTLLNNKAEVDTQNQTLHNKIPEKNSSLLQINDKEH